MHATALESNGWELNDMHDWKRGDVFGDMDVSTSGRRPGAVLGQLFVRISLERP